MNRGRSGSGGPVCDSRDIALSPLVLSDSSSSTGARCYGTDLAEASSVYAFPPIILLPKVLVRVRRNGVRLLSSPVLIGPSIVLRPDFSLRWLSMGDSHQEGSPLTGGRYVLHPCPELWKLWYWPLKENNSQPPVPQPRLLRPSFNLELLL